MNSMAILTQEQLSELLERAAERGALRAIKNLPKDEPDQVNKSEAAERLGVSRPTLLRMMKAGEIKLNKLGKIPMSEIDRVKNIKSSSLQGL